MLFTESFITDAGERLFARAAAQEGRIVWTRAATSSRPSDNDSTSQMNALDESTFGTKTSSGVVTNAVVNDQQNTATLYSELTNEEYNGEARTYGAWAKIEGDASDVLAIVARCGSGVTPTTVNPASAGVVKAFVDFELDITAEQAQSVQVSEGWYATQDALQDEIEAREALAGRVVTTHKAGDATAGDNQGVLGRKTYHDTVTFRSLTVFTDGISLKENANNNNATVTIDSSIDGKINSTIPIYAQSIYIKDPDQDDNYIFSVDPNTSQIYCGMELFVGAEATVEDDMTVKSKLTAYQLEVEDAVEGNLKVNGEISVGEYSTIGDDLHIGGDATVEGDVKVGYDLEVNRDIEVGGKINGVTPTPGEYPPPVGADFWAFIPTPSGYGDKDIGTTVTATSIAPIYYAGIQTTSNNGVYDIGFLPDVTTIEIGTYTLLAAITAPVGSPLMVVAHVKRTG